jgi:hypothetical protein
MIEKSKPILKSFKSQVRQWGMIMMDCDEEIIPS